MWCVLERGASVCVIPSLITGISPKDNFVCSHFFPSTDHLFLSLFYLLTKKCFNFIWMICSRCDDIKTSSIKNTTKDAMQRTILSARISFPRQIICLLNESTAHPHLFSNNQMLPIFLNWINCSIFMVNDYFARQNYSRVFPLLANI